MILSIMVFIYIFELCIWFINIIYNPVWNQITLHFIELDEN